MTLPKHHLPKLYRLIQYAMEERESTLIAIGGTPNHIHMLFDLRPFDTLNIVIHLVSVIIADRISDDEDFWFFKGWAKSYFATTISPRDVKGTAEYICNQPEIHSKITTEEEISKLCKRAMTAYRLSDFS